MSLSSVRSVTTWSIPLVLLELGLVFAWSSGFVGARFALDQAPPMLVVFWRSLVVLAVLAPFAWQPLLRAPPRTLWHTAGSGLLAMAGYLAGVVQGIALGVPAGLAALLADLLPLGVAVLSTCLPGRRLARGTWAGLALGLGGVLLVTADVLSLGRAPWWAYGLPLLGMLSLAIATLWQKQSRAAASLGLLPTLWMHCFASSLVFAALAAMEGGLSPMPTSGFAISVLWTALLSSLGGYGLYWACLKRSSATRVASVLYLSPAVTLGWAWAMFGDPLSWQMALGTLVSLGGVWLVIRAEARVHV